MMLKMLLFRGTAEEIRTESHKGKDHIVIPVTAMVQGVVHAGNSEKPELVLAAEFGRTVNTWNGRPVVINHPRVNGELVSANSPTVLEKEQIGTVFNAKVEDDKLVMEAWIEQSTIEALEEGNKKDTMSKVLDGGTVEVSVGAYVDVQETEGEYNGKRYAGAWTNISSDHLAILEIGVKGACSVEAGCGTNRAAEERFAENTACQCDACVQSRRETKKQEEKDKEQPLVLKLDAEVLIDELKILGQKLEVVFGHVSRDAELSYDDIRAGLEAKLNNKYENEWTWVIAVYNSEFVYYREGRFWKSSYTKTDNRVESLGDESTEVTPKTEFVAVESKEITVDKDKIVSELIAHPKTKFAQDDTEWLMGLDERQLEMLIPDEVEEEQEKAPPAPITAEQYIANAPAEVQEVLKAGMRLAAEEKGHYIKVLTDNPRNSFTKEQLNAMSTDQLKQIAKLADAPDYSAARNAAKPAEDNNAVPPMPQVFDLNKARSA